MKARVEYDLEYLRNWSLALDLQIFNKTATRLGEAHFFSFLPLPLPGAALKLTTLPAQRASKVSVQC